VASLGLASTGTATDGVTPIFSWKKLATLFLSSRLQSDDLFLAVRPRLLYVLYKFSHIFLFHSGVTPWMVSVPRHHPGLLSSFFRGGPPTSTSLVTPLHVSDSSYRQVNQRHSQTTLTAWEAEQSKGAVWKASVESFYVTRSIAHVACRHVSDRTRVPRTLG